MPFNRHISKKWNNLRHALCFQSDFERMRSLSQFHFQTENTRAQT